MTDPSLLAQTITISHNVALTAGFAVAFGGFMLGYAIGWRQRRDEPAADPGWPYLVSLPRDEIGAYDLGAPVDLDELRRLRDGAEDRVRRSQA